MKQFAFGAALILSAAAIAAAAETAAERLNVSAEVFQQVMNTPDKGIPQDLLAKAQTGWAGARRAQFAWKAAAWDSRSADLPPMW
jgi:hypothetical protein